ncbi:MAG: hypothetical protein RR382_11590 [Tannerellaceae bacterium]
MRRFRTHWLSDLMLMNLVNEGVNNINEGVVYIIDALVYINDALVNNFDTEGQAAST